jgi:hypothetical protein
MPGYGGTGMAALLHENRQQFLFQQEADLVGIASVAVQPERCRNTPPAGVSFQIYFTDRFGNPASPGIFEIDIQDSDIDQDSQYTAFAVFVGELNANYSGRVEIPALYGKYVRVFLKALTNPVYTTVYITSFAGVGGGVVMSTNPLPDAPQDGITYGREDGNWVPVVNLAGDTMTGPLTLANDPTLPLEAATKEYVDNYVDAVTATLSGILTFAGTIDGPSGTCQFFGPLAGDPAGPLPAPAPANNNYYFICTASGTPSSGPIAGTAITEGNWVVSDGTAYTVLPFSTEVVASNVVVSPTVAGASDVQTALTNINASQGNYLPLSGGTLTNNLYINPGNLQLATGTINVPVGGINVGSGGISTGGLVSTAQISAFAGMNFGSTLAANPQDLSKQIALFGTNSTTWFGFCVTPGLLNYNVAQPSNAHVFYVAGVEQGRFINTGLKMATGIDFGAAVVSSPQDLSRGLSIYNGGQMGFCTTNSQLNYNCNPNAAHVFYTATTERARIDSSGIHSSTGLDFGSTNDVNPQSTSAHITLWGTSPNAMGFGVTANQLNYDVPAGNSHAFYVGGVNTASINSAGLQFGSTNQSYLNWLNNTSAVSNNNRVVQASDSANRMLWQLQASQSGAIVGGNPEGSFQLWTNCGGYGSKQVMTTQVASPPSTIWSGALNAPAFNVTSDRRLKRNIRAVEEHEHRDAFAALKPVRFEWAMDGDPQWNRPKWGFVADDVEKGSAEIIHTHEDGMKGYDAVQVLALAVAEIHRLGKQVEALRSPWYRRLGKAVTNGHAVNGRIAETVNGHVSKLINALRLVFTRRKHARI